MSTPVNNYGYTYRTKAEYTAKTRKAEEAAEEQTAAADSQKEDGFEKASTVAQTAYKPDLEKVNALKSDLTNNVAAFKRMVQGLIKNQGGAASNAMNALLEIDEKTRLEAQQAVSEDGEWGVKAVAGRILEMAKALSGGDPAKIETLRQAVKDGFAAAEKTWGGKLPDISYQTLDRVMKGFDDWANGNTGAAEA